MSTVLKQFLHNIKVLTLDEPLFPEVVREIPDPPKQLYIVGDSFFELLKKPRITVIGSRKASSYGRMVTSQLALELARAGVVIVSGLAIGIDTLAHKAALEAHTPTIAVLPCGFDRIYPASHENIARQILEQGGALVTEYPPGTPVQKWNFLARNRIASALADGVLITEAAARSGTLSTARHALDQGREVLAVPGNITSPTSAGTNNLLKMGATPVTEAADIFYMLGLEASTVKQAPKSGNLDEQIILDLLQSGVSGGNDLLEQSNLQISVFNQSLTMLEIQGLIRPLGGNQWTLS
jgi:DNA processing protein